MKQKAFGLWSAALLGIGSMVGAGIFVLLGEAGAIAGNLVWISFVLGGFIAILAGYSLAKLAITYPSRGGMVGSSWIAKSENIIVIIKLSIIIIFTS